eukprot:gb/GECG01013948.1/.p1 GENE.gb/GECG01013948.1/~~gb/GECG01013948.1/.p1  ORF type:complete len:599 (+),score=74.58 gb/GECG01013948.1/:1-1797(+)
MTDLALNERLDEFEDLFEEPKARSSAPKRRVVVEELRQYIKDNKDSIASIATQEHYERINSFLFYSRYGFFHNGYKQSVRNVMAELGKCGEPSHRALESWMDKVLRKNETNTTAGHEWLFLQGSLCYFLASACSGDTSPTTAPLKSLVLQLMKICWRVERYAPGLVKKSVSNLFPLLRASNSIAEHMFSKEILNEDACPVGTISNCFQKIESQGDSTITRIWRSSRREFAGRAVRAHLHYPQLGGHRFLLASVVGYADEATVSSVVAEACADVESTVNRLFALTQLMHASSFAPENLLPGSLIRDLLHELPGFDQKQQEGCVSLFETMCVRSSDTSIPNAVGDTIKTYLVNQKAKVPKWSQRLCVIGLLHATFHGLQKNERIYVPDEEGVSIGSMLESLVAYIPTESNTDVIRAATRALGKGMSLCGKLPSTVNTWFSKCLQNAQKMTADQASAADRTQLIGSLECLRMASEVPQLRAHIKDNFLSPLRQQAEKLLNFDASEASFRYQLAIDASIQSVAVLANLSEESEEARRMLLDGSSAIASKQSPTAGASGRAGAGEGVRAPLPARGKGGKGGKPLPPALQVAAKSQGKKEDCGR